MASSARYRCLARRNMPAAPGGQRKRRTRFVIPADRDRVGAGQHGSGDKRHAYRERSDRLRAVAAHGYGFAINPHRFAVTGRYANCQDRR